MADGGGDLSQCGLPLGLDDEPLLTGDLPVRRLEVAGVLDHAFVQARVGDGVRGLVGEQRKQPHRVRVYASSGDRVIGDEDAYALTGTHERDHCKRLGLQALGCVAVGIGIVRPEPWTVLAQAEHERIPVGP